MVGWQKQGQLQKAQLGKGAQHEKEVVNATLDQVMGTLQEEDMPQELAQRLQNKITGLKSSSRISTMVAKDFTLDKAIFAFGLKVTNQVPGLESIKWQIQNIPETKNFPVTLCLSK
jgi:hypothetical protein